MGDRLTGRVAIVTGAGRGIGRGVAHLLAQEGASVVVNDLGGSVAGEGDSQAPADEVVNEIRDSGGTAEASLDSVAEYDSAAKVVQTAVNAYGKVDILVHVAGILRDRMVFNMTEAEWDAVLQVHLYGAFNMVRQVTPHMINQKYGRIVLFSSSSGQGSSGQANYSAAKEGMVGMARALAKEFTPHGISINAVYPGAATRMTESVPESTRDLRRSATAPSQPTTMVAQGGQSIQGPPEAREPENNAPKAVYLCTEAGGTLTGQVFGTSGWPMTLFSPRHVVKSIHKHGRWTLDELDDLMPISLGAGLTNPMPPQEPRPRLS